MKYFFTITIVLLGLTSCKYGETLKAFEQIDASVQLSQEEQIKDVTALKKQVTDSAMANPARYASAFNHANEFHTKTETLLAEIRAVKELINQQMSDQPDFEEMNEHLDEVFYDGEEPSEHGLRLKKALENYLLTAEDQLYFFPEAEKMAKRAFDTAPVLNREGKEIEWLEYNYKGYPAIASKTKLTLLEQEAYKVELTFLRALLEKPQF